MRTQLIVRFKLKRIDEVRRIFRRKRADQRIRAPLLAFAGRQPPDPPGIFGERMKDAVPAVAGKEEAEKHVRQVVEEVVCRLRKKALPVAPLPVGLGQSRCRSQDLRGIDRKVRIGRHAAALERQPVRPEITHFDHKDSDAGFSRGSCGDPVIGALFAEQDEVGDGVAADEGLHIGRPPRQRATVVMAAPAPPEYLVAGIEVDAQTAMTQHFEMPGDLGEDRRRRSLQEQEGSWRRGIYGRICCHRADSGRRCYCSASLCRLACFSMEPSRFQGSSSFARFGLWAAARALASGTMK